MGQRSKIVWFAVGTFFLTALNILGFSGIIHANDTLGAGWVSKLVSLQGDVQVRRHGQTHWQRAKMADTFFVGDQILVEHNSRAGILLSNETMIRLDQNTALIFTGIKQERSLILRLFKGVASFFSHRPRSLKILTPFVNGAVDGTEFVVQVDTDQTRIDLFEGQILAENEFGSLKLDRGEGIVAKAGKAPRRHILVPARESIQWAMYYPPVLTLEAGYSSLDLDKPLALFNEGRIPEAFARMESIDAVNRDVTFFVFRAAMRLHVGRISRAESDIRQALSLDPANSDALALTAVIAIVQNNIDAAVDTARQAVQNAPQSASAHIALSYALQAQFKLFEALESARQAVIQAPDNGLAWARLADLQLSVGDLDKGVRSAQKAVRFAPRTAHAYTVLGFAHLTRIETKKASEAFNEAIDLDSAAPLPRLGLGLAKIRNGDLRSGRSQIEIAAGLDPGNALIRSYLGKAYFDEKRDPQDAAQFNMAKALDPNDPTPWFYDAIRKQSINRPVDAFNDLQRAIELNDNRAVYRSRLLLDEDLAVRGASFARIYDDLGFQKKALMESTKSLSIDPTNHSAHRFFSESYTRYPQYQIAQVSELLQSQLFQPTNTNPVQPRMSIKGLNYLNTNSSSAAAFNGYDALFENEGQRFTASSVIGNHNTYGGEAALSGFSGKFSYSIGQYYYNTDGYREGSDVKHDVFDAYTQVALTNKANLQFEYRHRDTNQGDLRMFLNPDFSPLERRALEQDIGRAGLRISPSPNSHFLASFVYNDRREKYSENTLGAIDFSDNRDGYETEAQYIYHESQFNFLMGGGIYRTDGEWNRIIFFPPIQLPGFPAISIEPKIDEKKFEVDGDNIYAYVNIEAPISLTWTLGISYETFSDTQYDYSRERINPKFGLQWDISNKWRFRTAFVRNTKRLLAMDQTIEPTQVAGFNQFFDDINGTQSQLFGIATDIVLTNQLYGGIELTWRDVSRKSERDEEIYRGYLYWLPHPNWSVNTEYQFERDLYDFDLKTTMIPFSIRYFDHHGFFGQCCVTYVNQKQQALADRTLRDEFALVDMSVGYRLPNRWGLLTFEINNLLDKEFLYRDASFKTSDQFGVVRPFVPSRTVQARVVLNF